MKQREIKCRAISTDTGKWVYGSFYEYDGRAVILHKQGINLMQHTDVKPETCGEFTGLKDKNGKEIYEGDILHGREEGNGETTAWTDVYYIVFFKDGAFHVREKNTDENSKWCDYLNDNNILDYYEIIGNIHESAGLLAVAP